MGAKIRTTCKAVTDGETKGFAHRFGDTMGEASVETSKEVKERTPRTPPVFEPVTKAKLRIHEDGSGLFEFLRGETKISIRWTEEKEDGNLEFYADFNGVEGVLVRDDQTPLTQEAS